MPQFEPAVVARPDTAMCAFVAHPWAPCPMYDRTGMGVDVPAGGGARTHVAPGFEYALDAPMKLPAGSTLAPSVQPYWD